MAVTSGMEISSGNKKICCKKRAFLSDKYDITRHPNYRYLSDADPKNVFDIGKFLSCKLKVNPTDTFEVFETDTSEEP